MFTEKEVREYNRVQDLRRRHMQLAHAYVAAKAIIREIEKQRAPSIVVPFTPVHYYLYLLPGFNVHMLEAKYIGWRRLRAFDVTADPQNPGYITVSVNPDYIATRAR